jgi:hypothetical protein
MDKSRTSSASLILAIALLIAFPSAVYIGSYLALVVPAGRGDGDRIYHYRSLKGTVQRDWARVAFYPLEQIDRKLRPVAWATGIELRGGSGPRKVLNLDGTFSG